MGTQKRGFERVSRGSVTSTVIRDVPDEPESPLPEDKRSLSPLQISLRYLLHDRRALICTGILLFLVVLALIGPPIYQHIGGIYPSDLSGPIGPQLYHQYYHEELSRQDELPSAQYWLGTDSVGRDLLARLMQGLLISLTVAVVVEIVDVALGLLVGVLAGYYGGWLDQLLARFTDLMFAFPSLLFAMLLVGVFGSSATTLFNNVPLFGDSGNARLLVVSVALAFTSWPLMARYVRGQTMQIKEQQFIEAARACGTGNLRVIVRHIVPHLLSIVLVAATLDISGTIIGEAGISLLGFGVTDPGSSLGLMIADGLDLTATHPWEVLVPTVVLAAIVLSFSFLGDSLRDALDPKRNNR
jgi:oligopeptide transport system permease protein